MLRSHAILLLLVGAALASPQNAWKDGKEYTYKIKSRTLAAFNPESKQYTGIIMEGRLTVQPNGPETLRAKISQARYTPIHTRLDSWDSEVPENLMNMQNFPLSGKPFEIKTKNGVVKDLAVDKDVPTWEVNIIKSIISQLQIDTQGENAHKKSKHNQLPEGKQPYAMFKVMEDSVGGKCEVTYDVSPMPEQQVQSKPELVPMPELREDGDIMLLVKTKNYSNCDQRVSYHFGLNGRNKFEPGSNDNGKYLSRSSVSRAVLSGNPKKFTIQSSSTTNKVVLNPDQQENQQGMVASKIALTLHEVKDISEQISQPMEPHSTGNLVYNYNSPFETASTRRKNQIGQTRRFDDRDTSNSEERKWNKQQNNDESNEHDHSSDSSDSVFDNDENNYLQPKPKLTEPPFTPMLPYFIGNNGNSIGKNNKIDIVMAVKKVSQEIGDELQKPDNMPEQQTLEKFTILSRLIRTMNAEEIASAQRELYERPQSQNELTPPSQSQRARRNTWEAFRDAVAQAGTGPALVNVKQWVQSRQIQGNEAAKVVDAMAKSTRNPTTEYMDAYFEIIQSAETQQQPEVRDAATLAFADLIRHAIVNKPSAHNRYPVHAFGKFSHKNYRNLHAKYFPYMAEELNKAVENGDSQKIQVLATAIGRTAHPRMLSVLEPYIEGRKPVSPYQRLVMVMNLYKLATSYPKVARSVLYKIYSNNADHHEIRTAAAYLLMKTNPPASMLQRMADNTNYDSSKNVNSAVKSTIESLAQLDNGELSDAAKTALPLLTSETYGPQYSRAVFKNIKDPNSRSGVAIEANYIGSDDSIVPKGVSLTLTPSYNGLKVTKLQLGGSVSTVQNLWNFVQKKLSNDQNDNMGNTEAQQKQYSPENLARLLGIQGQNSEQVEGFAFMNDINGNHFWSFDNHSLEKIPQELRQWDNVLKRGMNFDETKMSNYEVTMSFPTETGYPLTFTLKAPTVVKMNGQIKTKSNADFDSQSAVPRSTSASGKMHIVYGMKIQKRLGFVAPFEHQEYMGGIDRDVQIHLPIRSEVEYDLNKREARVKIQANEDDLDFKVLQYKSQPFTAKHDILNLKPVSTDKSTQTVHKEHASSSQYEINDTKNDRRVQFVYERLSSRPRQEYENMENKDQFALEAAMKMARSVSSLYYPNDAEKVEYEKYTVRLSPNSDMSAEVKVSYDSMKTEGNNNNDSDDYSPKAKAPRMENMANMNENERKQALLREATQNINSARAGALDVRVKFNGNMESSITFTAAVGKSEVDPKSRALFLADAKSPDGQEFYISAGFEGKNPNVKSMDYEETLKAHNHHSFDSEVVFARMNDEQSRKKIKVEGKVKQSEERKNQIRQSRDAQECARQVNQHGNKMNPACQKINERAATVDTGDFVITFENDLPLKQMALRALNSAQLYTPENTERDPEDKSEQDKIKVSFEMSPNDDKVDLVVKTPDGKLRINDIKLPRNSYQNNENDYNKDRQSLRQMMSTENNCILDKTQAKTFDNHRYSLKLGKCWHVVMTPYPKANPDRPTQQQEVPMNMHASIMARENENGQKELKITLGDKEVELSASGSHKVEAKVNGKKIDYSKNKSHQEKKNGDIEFEIFELHDGSVKLISDQYNVRITYDGERAMIKAGDRYRDSIRGLCGNNDAEPENDQQSPKGCLLNKPEEFSATYALTNDNQCQGPARDNAKKAENAECTYISARPGNVISDREAGRVSERNDDSNENNFNDKESRKCMKHRTMVTRTESQICFSLRPLPKCSSSCSPHGMKSRKIDFHCVPRSSASEKVAERVEKGANPDLSQKTVSKTENHQIPITCKV